MPGLEIDRFRIESPQFPAFGAEQAEAAHHFNPAVTVDVDQRRIMTCSHATRLPVPQWFPIVGVSPQLRVASLDDDVARAGTAAKVGEADAVGNRKLFRQS